MIVILVYAVIIAVVSCQSSSIEGCVQSGISDTQGRETCELCASGLSLSQDKIACNRCPSGCQCDNYGICQSCLPNLGLYLLNGKCQSCGTGCKKCDSNNKCKECVTGQRLDLTTQSCSICQLDNCEACDENMDCISCAIGYKLSEGTCKLPSNNNNSMWIVMSVLFGVVCLPLVLCCVCVAFCVGKVMQFIPTSDEIDEDDEPEGQSQSYVTLNKEIGTTGYKIGEMERRIDDSLYY